MTNTTTTGFGLGETGCYTCTTGVPNDIPLWQHDPVEGRDGVLSSHSFQPVSDRVLYWPGTGSLNLLDMQTGTDREVSHWSLDESPYNPQLCMSNNRILVGARMLNAETFESTAMFPELGPGNADRLTEQVIAPVHDGFICLGGMRPLPASDRGPLAPIVPRTLYHIHAISREIRTIADDVTAFVMLAQSDVYYALRNGRLVCTLWETGERVWERDHTLDLKWHDNVNETVRQNRHDAPLLRLMCTDNSVYVLRKLAFLNRYDAGTGEMLEQLDSSLANWKSPTTRLPGKQHFVSDDYLYIASEFGNVSETIAVSIKTGEEILRTSTKNATEYGAFVCGDLLFYIDRYNAALLARDRFTGEKVWEVAYPVPNLHDACPLGNKILFYSMTGPMACFEWDAPYVSPH